MKNSNLLQKVQYIKSVYPETFDKMSLVDVKGKIFLAFGKQDIDRDAKNNSLYKAIERCKKPEEEQIKKTEKLLDFGIDAVKKADQWDRIPNFIKKLLLLLIK